jgi:hypothetical protein
LRLEDIIEDQARTSADTLDAPLNNAIFAN